MTPTISAQQQPQAAIPFDHHVHVLSPALIEHWKSVGARFSRADWEYADPQRFCEKLGIDKAFLISMAHLYTTDDFSALENVQATTWQLLQQENDFIAACVSLAPDRFIGFFSVDPLDERALAEIDRCRQQKHLSGVKLHLPACEVNLNKPEHVAALLAVFQKCHDLRMPMLIHLSSPDAEFGAKEARIFWQQLVKPHPRLELYCAHLGGAGGYNHLSQSVLNEYLELLNADPQFAAAPIYFELSGAILAEPIEGLEATSAERCAELAEQIRRVGAERFLFGSDYPVFSPPTFRQALIDKLPLDAATWETLWRNHSPRFGK